MSMCVSSNIHTYVPMYIIHNNKYINTIIHIMYVYIYIHMYIIKRTVHTYVRIYGYITFMILLSKQQKSRVQATQMRVL